MLVKLFTGDDGESHFEDLDMKTWPLEWSITLSGQPVNFKRREPGYFYDWHNESRRQYVITVAGELEAVVSDGTVKRFKSGDILFAEDLEGPGHTTGTVGSEPWVYVSIPLGNQKAEYPLAKERTNLSSYKPLIPGTPRLYRL